MWERRLRQKLGSLATALGAEPAPLPPALEEELKNAAPPLLPPTLGIDTVEEQRP
jgi:outer membrane protein TolC